MRRYNNELCRISFLLYSQKSPKDSSSLSQECIPKKNWIVSFFPFSYIDFSVSTYVGFSITVPNDMFQPGSIVVVLADLVMVVRVAPYVL